MYVPLTLLVIHSRELDLPQNDGAIRRRAAAALNEVSADREGDKVLVGDAGGAGPHAGLVYVPVVARLDDLGLDLVLNDLEGLKGLLGGCMRRVELDLLGGGCACPRW